MSNLLETAEHVALTLLTFKEAKEVFGVSRSTIYRWIRSDLMRRVGEVEVPASKDSQIKQKLVLLEVVDAELKEEVERYVKKKSRKSKKPLFVAQEIAEETLSHLPKGILSTKVTKPDKDDKDNKAASELRELVNEFEGLLLKLSEESERRSEIMAELEEAAKGLQRDARKRHTKTSLKEVVQILRQIRQEEDSLLNLAPSGEGSEAEMVDIEDSHADARLLLEEVVHLETHLREALEHPEELEEEEEEELVEELELVREEIVALRSEIDAMAAEAEAAALAEHESEAQVDGASDRRDSEESTASSGDEDDEEEEKEEGTEPELRPAASTGEDRPVDPDSWVEVVLDDNDPAELSPAFLKLDQEFLPPNRGGGAGPIVSSENARVTEQELAALEPRAQEGEGEAYSMSVEAYVDDGSAAEDPDDAIFELELSEDDLPEWLSETDAEFDESLDEDRSETQADTTEPPGIFDLLPDWLSDPDGGVDEEPSDPLVELDDDPEVLDLPNVDMYGREQEDLPLDFDADSLPFELPVEDEAVERAAMSSPDEGEVGPASPTLQETLKEGLLGIRLSMIELRDELVRLREPLEALVTHNAHLNPHIDVVLEDAPHLHAYGSEQHVVEHRYEEAASHEGPEGTSRVVRDEPGIMLVSTGIGLLILSWILAVHLRSRDAQLLLILVILANVMACLAILSGKRRMQGSREDAAPVVEAEPE